MGGDRIKRWLARFAGLPILVALAVLTGGSLAGELWRLTPSPDETLSRHRLREGTRVSEQLGTVRQRDNRWYFDPLPVAAGASQASELRSASPGPLPPTQLLENLSLQRIVRLIGHDTSDNQWLISGVVTEFFGENQLLIESATRAPAAPDGVR